jgi:RNA polymerase sigma-70 factor (ECF subfamily)
MLSCGPFSSFLRARPARSFPDITSHMSAEGSSAPPPATDEIIERCLNGDQSAWESIVRMYRRKVFNVAYKFVGRHDQAEDLTQDVFLKLYKSLDTFDRRANFQTWLISVSRNLCIDHYRAVRKERETINRDVDPADFMPVSPDPRADAQLEQRDRVHLLRRALDKLAPTLRTAVMLRDIQELTYQEIADKLHLPEGTVKSRINRGRTELARQIQKLRDQQDAIPKTGVSG